MSDRQIIVRRRLVARGFFYSHRWLGVTGTAVILVIAVTGILLNHKRGLGLMPDVDHEPAGHLDEALPLSALAAAAAEAVDPLVAETGVDRMDARPDNGIIKVRFNDRHVTEVTLDLHSAGVLHVGQRNDQFLLKLHSGEIFGDRWVLLSDAAAVLLALLVISGLWLWLYPKSRV